MASATQRSAHSRAKTRRTEQAGRREFPTCPPAYPADLPNLLPLELRAKPRDARRHDVRRPQEVAARSQRDVLLRVVVEHVEHVDEPRHGAAPAQAKHLLDPQIE